MDKNIQYILEVARCGGITKAANKLYITPSALSRFVQARESELNVLLFHRVGKRFIPTEAGKYYIQKCQEHRRLQDNDQERLRRCHKVRTDPFHQFRHLCAGAGCVQILKEPAEGQRSR